MKETPIARDEDRSKQVSVRERSYKELWEEQRQKDEQREKAEQARIEAALEAHKQSFSEMIAMPVAQKANAQLALLTNGVLECMRSASLHLNSEVDQFDPRLSPRRAELRDAALLSTASARILDAYTRFQHGLSKQQSSQSAIREAIHSAVQAMLVIRENEPNAELPADFGMTGEMFDAALALERHAPDTQTAEG